MFAWIQAMLYMILPDSVPGLRREDIQGLADIAPADVVELAELAELAPGGGSACRRWRPIARRLELRCARRWPS